VQYASTHSIKVQTTEFSFSLDNSDHFINQAVVARVPLAKITAHGLFGQTSQRQLYKTPLKFIAGDVDDYVLSEDSLFGSDFVYTRFQQA